MIAGLPVFGNRVFAPVRSEFLGDSQVYPEFVIVIEFDVAELAIIGKSETRGKAVERQSRLRNVALNLK